jgi:hypothetical protein
MSIPIPVACTIPNLGKRHCWISEESLTCYPRAEALPKEVFERLPGEVQNPSVPEWHPPFVPYKMYESVTDALRAFKEATKN